MIVDTFSQYGSFGINTQIDNPAGQYSVDNSPRFTGLNNIPPLQGVNIPSGSCEEIAPGTNTITVTNTLMAIDCG